MPVLTKVECDRCRKSLSIRGDFNKGLEVLKSQGWKVATLVNCPQCIKEPIPVEVCSDGSTVGKNPGYGGWGFASANYNGSGPADEHPTTNQRMEIKAAIEALRAFGDPVRLYSDSQYVVRCINERWYAKWMKNDWHKADGDPVINADLWKELVEILEAHPNLEVVWVKGHADHELNNKADELARAAATKFRAKIKAEAAE